jgi:phytoene dehydrogenase-like protein
MEPTANYDVIVVGGGVAGLTATAYLAKSGAATLLCEQAATCGGLVHTFARDGFVYDGGIRAMENSGIVFPMLKDLGLDLPFVKNPVSIGIEDRVLRVTSAGVLDDYEALLADLYPESRDEIAEIVARMRRIMHYMDIQYGIDNPIFLDPKEDRDYFIKEILPWVFRYALTVRKVNALKVPVVDYLRRFTQNESLLDIIAQHFFRETPAFFALSYFSLYLDYHYPLGGTGSLARAFTAFIEDHGGAIKTNTRIAAVDPVARSVADDQGHTYGYRTLIWAANQTSLYEMVAPATFDDAKVQRTVQARRELVRDKTGGDSVLTVYLAVDLDPDYFRERASAHVFYTPRREGQSQAGPLPLDQDRAVIEAWLRDFFALTTYEISCPVLRDPTLAPPGKTGLIVSVLFDYELTRQIEAQGWYEDFKALCESAMIKALDGSLYPGLKDAVLDHFSSTPLTMARITSNADGAITGWAFTNDPVPAESRLPKVVASVRTPIPHVYQAGQWTFSPSGFPTAILSGKLASDQALKALKR